MKKIVNVALLGILLLSTVIKITATTRVYASPKSMYLIRNHHIGQFDAWEIKPDGTVEYQATYWLSYATDPAGIAIDESSSTLFITSEFSPGIEMVNATTMTSIGVSPGPIDLAGIAVDDANDVVYAVLRYSNKLYIYDWDPVTKTLTPRVGYDPLYLPGCSGAFGIALDDKMGILWVADTAAGIVRAYDINTWTEDAAKSFTPSHAPVDVEVDRRRGFVYTVSMYPYVAWLPPTSGSDYISKFDLNTRTETLFYMGHDGVGIAVDEVTGYVYVTGCSDAAGTWFRNLEVWDPATGIKLQDTGPIGTPAGICIPREEVAYNPLHLSKSDTPDPVVPGGTITYTISYDNLANNYDVHNVVLIDYLPPETIFVSASGGGTYDPITHTVTWSIGTLPALSGPYTETLTVTVKTGTPEMTIVNYLTIDSDETPPTTILEETTVYVPPLTPGKVTGGGQIVLSPKARASFGFNVMYQENWTAPKGEFLYVDQEIKMIVHSHNMTSLIVSPDKTKATFEGTCTINGVSGFTYTIYVEDNGEPGKNDVFKITLSTGYSASGTLLTGNIQIHKKP